MDYQLRYTYHCGWCQVDTLHSGEYCGDAIDEAEERFNRRAMQLSFLSNMCAPYALASQQCTLLCLLCLPAPFRT